MPALPPRIVIAGSHSGVGKTTVATGLMAALCARGIRVAGAKVGPDFIDPGYHRLATGRPSRNLDSWICGREAIAPLAARAAEGCDLLVVEGVMGLFDGAAPGTGPSASTAEIAQLLEAPVVLVVDASAMSGSVAALVHGYATFEPGLRTAGVVLNRVGSDSHEAMLRAALNTSQTPVLGSLRRDQQFTWRDRHLGLVPVVEDEPTAHEALDRLATTLDASCDIEAILAIARSAPPKQTAFPPSAAPRAQARIALAGGPSFSFYYPDNLELLQQAGAELVPFDPRSDPQLPEGTQAIYAGGGFPEVFAHELSTNRPLLDDVARFARGGGVIWAECGGLLWLSRRLDAHTMAGVLAAAGRMGERLTLGYREATTREPSPLGPPGTGLRGHEFHYSSLDPAGDGLELTGRTGTDLGGYLSPTLFASYLHLHLGSRPDLAERFVAAAAKVRPAAVNGKPVRVRRGSTTVTGEPASS